MIDFIRRCHREGNLGPFKIDRNSVFHDPALSLAENESAASKLAVVAAQQETAAHVLADQQPLLVPSAAAFVNDPQIALRTRDRLRFELKHQSATVEGAMAAAAAAAAGGGRAGDAAAAQARAAAIFGDSTDIDLRQQSSASLGEVHVDYSTVRGQCSPRAVGATPQQPGACAEREHPLRPVLQLPRTMAARCPPVGSRLAPHYPHTTPTTTHTTHTLVHTLLIKVLARWQGGVWAIYPGIGAWQWSP